MTGYEPRPPRRHHETRTTSRAPAKQLTARISPDAWDLLHAVAARRGWTLKAAVERAIELLALDDGDGPPE